MRHFQEFRTYNRATIATMYSCIVAKHLFWHSDFYFGDSCSETNRDFEDEMDLEYGRATGSDKKVGNLTDTRRPEREYYSCSIRYSCIGQEQLYSIKLLTANGLYSVLVRLGSKVR